MSSSDNVEKLPQDEEAAIATRAVAFPDEGSDIQEKAPHVLRPKGVEMKRELTKEDKELANAGYDELDHTDWTHDMPPKRF